LDYKSAEWMVVESVSNLDSNLARMSGSLREYSLARKLEYMMDL